MSYSITIVKDPDGVRIEATSGLEYIPDGCFVVNGHQPSKGTSSIATIGVTLTSATQYIGGANGTFATTITDPAQ